MFRAWVVNGWHIAEAPSSSSCLAGILSIVQRQAFEHWGFLEPRAGPFPLPVLFILFSGDSHPPQHLQIQSVCEQVINSSLDQTWLLTSNPYTQHSYPASPLRCMEDTSPFAGPQPTSWSSASLPAPCLQSSSPRRPGRDTAFHLPDASYHVLPTLLSRNISSLLTQSFHRPQPGARNLGL